MTYMIKDLIFLHLNEITSTIFYLQQIVGNLSPKVILQIALKIVNLV